MVHAQLELVFMGPKVEVAVTGKNANKWFCGIQIVTTNIKHYPNEFMDYVWSCVLCVHLLRIILDFAPQNVQLPKLLM